MRVLIDKAGLASTLLCDYLHKLLAEKELTVQRVCVCVCVCVCVYTHMHAWRCHLPFNEYTHSQGMAESLSPLIPMLYFIDSKTCFFPHVLTCQIAVCHTFVGVL